MIELEVNGDVRRLDVEPRVSLLDALREELGLGGVHAGCEQGVCGACTVLVNERPVRSCLMFAVQAEGAQVTTIEALAGDDGRLDPIQEAFSACHALQCGFCTPGMIISTKALLEANPDPTEDEVRLALAGNICRCTGYVNIVRAVRLAAERMRG